MCACGERRWYSIDRWSIVTGDTCQLLSCSTSLLLLSLVLLVPLLLSLPIPLLLFFTSYFALSTSIISLFLSTSTVVFSSPFFTFRYLPSHTYTQTDTHTQARTIHTRTLPHMYTLSQVKLGYSHKHLFLCFLVLSFPDIRGWKKREETQGNLVPFPSARPDSDIHRA